MWYDVLECDFNGQELNIIEHNITLKIPQGAVRIGTSVHLEVAVTMHGPFVFSESSARPISPILWLCFLEDVLLQKPFKVILPHFLIGLTNDKAQYYSVSFAKASHEYSLSSDSQLSYKFLTYNGYQSTINTSYGTLLTTHCCYLCIKAEHSEELIKGASYCLVRIEPTSHLHQLEIDFAAILFLDTCLEVREHLTQHDTYNFI